MTGLRVLTINLWGMNGPVASRMADLGRWLRDTHPDVVALQEVEDWNGTTQAHYLAEEGGYANVHHTRSDHEGRRGEGLAILTDLDGDAGPPVILPGSPEDHPRAMQQVDVAVDGLAVRIVNTHLTWQLHASETRVSQLHRIRGEIAGWSGPVVVAGDLNDIAGSPALRVLTWPVTDFDPVVDCFLAVHDAETWTFDPANPYMTEPSLANRRVDHVLARGFDVDGAAVVLTGAEAPIVSDHYGVLVTLRAPTT